VLSLLDVEAEDDVEDDEDCRADIICCRSWAIIASRDDDVIVEDDELLSDELDAESLAELLTD